jgi:hypothetical protein
MEDLIFMKKSQILKLSLAAVLALAISIPVFSLTLGGKEMVKNGAGSRTKFMMKVYWATLYVPQELKGASDTQIIDADQPMSIDLLITSGMITSDKLISAIIEGFDQSAKAGYPTPEKQAFVALYKNVVIAEGDTFSHRYETGKGISIVHSVKGGQSKVLGTLKGLETKKAFWGIFLSSKPIQGSLKNNLLGK